MVMAVVKQVTWPRQRGGKPLERVAGLRSAEGRALPWLGGSTMGGVEDGDSYDGIRFRLVRIRI